MSKFHTSSLKAMRHFLVAASALTLAACATTAPTPYQEASKPGAFDGFSQQLIENDRARISAAEVAVERGYQTFTLQEQDIEKNTRQRVTPGLGSSDPFFRYSFFRPGFGWSRSFGFSHSSMTLMSAKLQNIARLLK